MTFWAQKLLRQPDTASAATKVMGSRFFAGSSSSWTSWMHGLFSSSTVGRRDHASRLGLNRAHWEDIRTTGSRRKLQEAAGSHCLAILALCWRRWWSHYKFTPCRPRSSQTKSQLSPHPFAWLVPQVSCFQSGDAGNLLERCDCWSAGCIRIHLTFGCIWHVWFQRCWRYLEDLRLKHHLACPNPPFREVSSFPSDQLKSNPGTYIHFSLSMLIMLSAKSRIYILHHITY